MRRLSERWNARRRAEAGAAHGLRARQVILEHFRTDLVVETKRDDTPVTIADRKAEERIRAIIDVNARLRVVGEEFGTQKMPFARW